MRLLLRILPFGLILAAWLGASLLLGEELVPGPVSTTVELAGMVASLQTWRHVCLTVYRGTAGLLLAVAGAYLLGIPCGLSPTAMRVVTPLVTALQSCPPIVWISLLLVWAGVGATVPILVVAAAAFPVLFLNMAQGTAALDRGLFDMARLYRLPRRSVLRHIILPGTSRYALAAFSFALGITWKVTATAEFFGSGNGIGARIYWAYRVLDMPRLFAWTFLIILIGMGLETGIVHPIRDRLQAHDRPAGKAP
ncbi:MAG: ABC transporter permease subunit [Lentisphaeria bacterium]|nr:ABC transporter permease subunit [Lentisphaeria bacterium]